MASLPLSPIAAAANHLLASAPWARERLLPHAGRHARLNAEPVALSLVITEAGLLAPADDDTQPDVVLSFPLSALPKLIEGGADTAMSHIRIEGAADLADALGFVFRNLRWDAEEDLSRLVGDIAAHRLVHTGRQVRAAHQRAVRALGSNVTEYLTEERPVLVGRSALQAHSEDVQALRDAIARLEKRIDRL